MVVYDVTDPASFEGAKGWVDEIRRREPAAIICLAGNKVDKQGHTQVSGEVHCNNGCARA